MDIKALLSELVEIEYASIRVELYIKNTDDVKSKLDSGLILNKSLINAYKEKIKGLHKYYLDLDYLVNLIPTEYIEKMKNIVQNSVNYINGVIYSLESGLPSQKVAELIKTDQDLYSKIIHNNNIVMNNLADRYLKGDHEEEEILETSTLIQESNDNKDYIDNSAQEIKTVYKEHPNTENVDKKMLYEFQISEIEKAIAEIEGKNEKTRKDINELYRYHNEILKIKTVLSQY